MKERNHKKTAAIFALLTAGMMLTGCSAARKQPNINNLPLGSPTLKHHRMEIRDGHIYSAASGSEITLDELANRLSGARLIYLGESHTSMKNHRAQYEIIRALHARRPRLKIGMEFFKRQDDPALARWSAGELTEEELLRLTGWYEGGGGYNFGYYRDIMNFARDNRLPVVGLNIPRAITRKIAMMGGFKALSEEERAEIGEVDTSHEEHRELIRVYFSGASGEGGMQFTPEMFENMYAAQSTWDTAMADSALRALEGFDGIVVVIAGSGHCAYNLGINRRANEKSPAPFATVLAVHTEEGGRGEVVRSLANYFWGIGNDLEPPFYPSLGFSIRDRQGRFIAYMVDPQGPAGKAGISNGDQVSAIDGHRPNDLTDLRMRLASKSWGDKVVLTVHRGGEELEIPVAIEK